MSHETAVLAFRLYGEFDWPPIPNHENQEEKRAVVEIWFVPEDGAIDKYNAVLNWAINKLPEPPPKVPKKNNAYLMSRSNALKAHFGKSNNQGALWINKGNAILDEISEVLRFSGAILFEQHTDHSDTLQWPLARKFNYGKPDKYRNYFSTLEIGETKKASFAFNIGLAAPVRQSSNNSYNCPKVFNFKSTYDSTAQLDKIANIKSLFRLPLTAPLNLSHSKVLGQFGFAINPVAINAFASKPVINTESHYFSSGDHEAVFDFLEFAGFDVSNINHLSTAGQINRRNEFQTSLIPSETSEFIWKQNLQVNPNSSGGSGNVIIDCGSFYYKFNPLLKPYNQNEHNIESILCEAGNEILCELSLKRPPITKEQIDLWLNGSKILLKQRITIRISHQSPNFFIAGLQRGLRTILAAQPQSFFPHFKSEPHSNQFNEDEYLKYYLTKNLEFESELGSGFPEIKDSSPFMPGWSGTFEITFPNFLDKNVKLTCIINPDDLADSNKAKYLIQEITLYDSDIACTGRLGALEFEFNKNLLVNDPENRSAITIRRTATGLVYHLNLRLEVNEVTPVTIDIPWGERDINNAPLLIPEKNDVSNKTIANPSKFTLVIEETFGDKQDWQLKAQLINKKNSDNTSQTFNVISEQPFAIFRFSRAPLSSSGDELNSAVAIYNSDQRNWQFKKVADSYHYVLPPQAVGETTDKPGRLEIHDTEIQEGEVVRPYPDANNPLRTHLVEYRLTPSTELWIKPSDLTRNYFLPEWSAHEIFRQRNDFGLGVALLGLRGEFLYGLSVGVDVSKEQGVSKHARVAEIEALMGRLPQDAKATQSKDHLIQTRLTERWHQLRPALQRRHERLELWAQDPASKQIFAPARFTDGVSFALRQSALHRAPVLDPEPTLDNNSDIAPADNTFPLPEPENLNGNIRYHPQGLAGGVLWPVEFWNLFKALCDHPQSSGGSLEQVALSPTGGDANQKALFLNGLLSIISETRGGFVQRQQVEVLGRIGAHWHRAKHVVVYERTVNPSAQFAPEYAANGSHSTRSRRPILRKVSEYIELLQPERFYPDGAGDVKQSGFLKSIRFNSIRIAVDSAWGEEVSEVGYKIPLWNQYSARTRPQVYPMPDVVFNLLCEGSTDDDSSAKQCLDPDNIYFFTDIESRTPDTDNWVARIGIDALLSLPPDTLTNILDEESKTDYKASASRILPGYRSFTWRLATGGPKARINAGYGDKPIYAEVESITFMRNVAPVTGTNKEGQEELISLTNSLTSSKLPLWTDATNSDDAVSELKTLEHAFYKQAEAVANGSTTDTTQARQAFNSLEDGVNQLKTMAGKWQELDTFAKGIANKLRSAKNLLTDIEPKIKNCEAFKQQAVDAIRRKRQMLEALLSDWQNQAIKHLTFVDASVVPEKWREETTVKIRESVIEALTPVFTSAFTPLNSINTDVEKARSIVHASQQDIERILLRGMAKLNDLKSYYHDDKPWSKDRLDRFKQKLQQQQQSVLTELHATLAEANQRLAVDLSQRSHQLSALACRALQAVGIKLSNIISSDLTFPTLPINDEVIDQLIDDFITQLQGAATQTQRFSQEVFATLDSKINQLINEINALKEAFKAPKLVEIVFNKTICPWLKRLLDSVQDEWIQNNPDKIRSYLRQGLQNFAEEIAGAKGALSTLERDAISLGTDIGAICNQLTNSYQAELERLKSLETSICAMLKDKVDAQYQKIKALLGEASNYPDILASAKDAASALGDVVDSVSTVADSAKAVGYRMLDAASQAAGSNLSNAPNNVLKLYSAATSALNSEPLQTNIHQLRCNWDQVIRTTKANAMLSQLGDALKAMGLDIPFDGFGDTFKIDTVALEKFDLSSLFKNFAGLNLQGLFNKVKLPANTSDAIALSHDFDKQQARAWVQVDVNVKVPGRNALFAVGPFVMYLKDTHLRGNIRLEASKDTDRVQESGYSELQANIEASVGGQVMVTLANATIRYTEQQGLKFDFDPANIRLHPNFRFIQDTLARIFPDEAGGLTIVKESGIPVGVEHLFTLPNMSLSFGTSGVQNIQIANRFRLLAFPDFIIANRFNLSSPELPFIFSIFILGGSGYIQIDTEYRPMDKQLMVVVEAAAGGSAAMAFSFGPVQGAVFMTLSVALTYRKLIGKPGGGLSVSLVLVVAGYVSLWGIVRVYLGLMLRLTYRDNGQIDAQGTLIVEVRVSRFYKLKYRTTVIYKLRGGKAELSRNSSVDVQTESKLNQARENAQTLITARS